jgi:hypothetical protein
MALPICPAADLDCMMYLRTSIGFCAANAVAETNATADATTNKPLMRILRFPGADATEASDLAPGLNNSFTNAGAMQRTAGLP